MSSIPDRLKNSGRSDEGEKVEHISTGTGDPPDVVASAPGRVEFIGNHTDYNGGWVLGATIDRRVGVGLFRRDDRTVSLESASDVPSVELSLEAVTPQTGERTWANYILGVLSLLREDGLAVDSGFHLLVESDLPVGAGLSSSAALELATAFALVEAFGGDFTRRELARLARRAENEFVGVPCGLLDQAVVAFGDRDGLVRLDARTEEISTVPFPADTRLWIFRTPEAHALADGGYQQRYDEAHEARDRLDELLGGVKYLVDVSPSQLESVRDEMPDVLYRRARHITTEHRRVKQAIRLLKDGQHDVVGELLFASHESSRTDYENSTQELDFVVDQLADTDHVLGARLTGAGFGGAAMAWTRSDFGTAEADVVSEAYLDRFGEEIDVIEGRPAPGCTVHT